MYCFILCYNLTNDLDKGMNREKYILEQLTDDEIINKIDMNLSVTQLNEIIDEAQGSGISVEEYLAVVDKEEKIVIEKEKYKDSFKNIRFRTLLISNQAPGEMKICFIEFSNDHIMNLFDKRLKPFIITPLTAFAFSSSLACCCFVIWFFGMLSPFFFAWPACP